MVKINNMDNKWISVKKSLPDYDESVLWIDEQGYQFILDIDHDSDWSNFQSWHTDFNNEIVKITHWQPLPNPPDEEDLVIGNSK